MSDDAAGAHAAPTRDSRAKRQQDRAIETITSIMSGGDLSEETLTLSNEFTDSQTARLSAWLRRPKR